jgi:hypothetical protein
MPGPESVSEPTYKYQCDRIRAVALDVTDERAADYAIQSAVDPFGRSTCYGDVNLDRGYEPRGLCGLFDNDSRRWS